MQVAHGSISLVDALLNSEENLSLLFVSFNLSTKTYSLSLCRDCSYLLMLTDEHVHSEIASHHRDECLSSDSLDYEVLSKYSSKLLHAVNSWLIFQDIEQCIPLRIKICSESPIIKPQFLGEIYA